MLHWRASAALFAASAAIVLLATEPPPIPVETIEVLGPDAYVHSGRLVNELGLLRSFQDRGGELLDPIREPLRIVVQADRPLEDAQRAVYTVLYRPVV